MKSCRTEFYILWKNRSWLSAW